MNTLEAYITENPQYIQDTCAKFTIDTTAMPFVLNDITAVNEQYTFSFWIKSDKAGGIQVYGEDFVSATAWQKHSIVFTASNTKFSIYFTSIGTYYVYHPKLEFGNMATDWTPSPEDLETTVVDLTTRVSDAETAIESTNEAISLRATREELVETTRMMTGLVADEIDGIQVGGRNLAKNTTLLEDARNGNAITYTGGGRLVYTADILADLVGATIGEPGECVTLSFEYRLVTQVVESSIGVKVYPYQDNGNTILDSGYIFPTNGWQKYVLTTRAVQLENGGDGEYTEGEIYVQDLDGDNVFEIRKIKLEKGTKATDWTPAPDDMVDAGTLEAYKQLNSAELQVTANAIKMEVSEQITGLTNADDNLMSLYKELRMNYDFTAEGQFIGKKDSDTMMKLVNDMLQILIAGSPVTTLDTSGLSASMANIEVLRIGDYSLTRGVDGHLRII